MVIVQGEGANIDEGVATASTVMVGVGAPLLLMKRNHARIRGRYRVLMVDKGSGFYMPDLRRDADESARD